MIINNTTYIKQCTRLKTTNFTQELVGLLCIRLHAILIQVKPIASIQRIFKEFLKLIDRANPLLYFLRYYVFCL